MPHVFSLASSGRAKCRGCGNLIEKGTLRFGEQVPNPFGDGDATFWFHPFCAAGKRPEPFRQLDVIIPNDLENRAQLIELADQGIEHYRLARIKRAERAKSGRAKCRQCKRVIDKGVWRLALDIWEEGRFNPIGFIHVSCSEEYFGTKDILARVRYFTDGLSDAGVREITDILG